MVVNIKLNDVRKYMIEDARKIEKSHRNAVKMAARDEVEKIFNSYEINIMLQLQSSKHVHTNELLELMYKKQIDSAGYRWEIGNYSQHASYIEYGTRAHPIQAASGKLLIFEVDELLSPFIPHRRNIDGSYTLFLKSVKHPGTKAYKLLSRAVVDNDGYFEKRLYKYLKEISL